MSDSNQNSVKKSEDNTEVNENTLKFIIKRSSSYKYLCGLLSGVCLTSFIFLITLPDPNILNETFYQLALGCFVISFLIFFLSLIVFNWIESLCFVEKYIDTNLNKNRLQNRIAIMDLFSNLVFIGSFFLIIGIFIVFAHFSPGGIQIFLNILAVAITMGILLVIDYLRKRSKKE